MLSYFFSSRLITSENMHSAGQPSVPVVVLTNPSFGDSLSTPPHSPRNSISTTARPGNDRRDSSSSSDSSNDAAICSPTTSSVMAAARKQRDGRRGRRVGPAVIIVDEDGNSKVAPESVAPIDHQPQRKRNEAFGGDAHRQDDEPDYDAIEVQQESPDPDRLHPLAAEALSDASRRTSDVSLYQQQKRVRLSIPCEPCHLALPEGDAGGPPDPSSRANIFKRRSAVHGLSPNTGLSIGAVM